MWWAAVAFACVPIDSGDRVLLVVPETPGVSEAMRARVERVLRNEGGWLPRAATDRALGEEGGARRRARVLAESRTRLARAQALFRELEDEAALDVLAGLTSALTSVHQEPEAVALLARSHLLAGAIYLARGRTRAGRTRLQRALDLDPELNPSRIRYAPRVLMELAALRATERAVGRLVVERLDGPPATVYLDGRPVGTTPLSLPAVPEGRHLLRVSAPGATSYLSTVDVARSRDTRVRVRLLDDPEVQRVGSLGPWRARGVEDVLRLLIERGRADRVVVAWVRPAAGTSLDGRPQLAVQLRADGGGATSAILSDIPSALEDLRTCRPAAPRALGFSARPAPAAVPRMPALQRARSSRETDRKWFASPWAWGAAGAVVFGVTAAVVAARAAQGPPDAVQIRVTPRP